ncbi:MAG: class I SAM-dependent methyltransferase [Clostridia bacterium]|nr:class I SAM-dependent methyltransferase [Clostridia bacterium]
MKAELEMACAEWAEAGQHGTVEERIARSRRWLAYCDMMAERQGDSWNEEGTPTKIAEYLKQKGCISEQLSVLDIGAGCGSYTLPLARRSAWVRALDMSAQSLLVIRRRAQKAGIGNILCEQEAWERFNGEQSYGFVFSAMCPAICNYDELRRMEKLSRGYCGLVTVARGSYDLHRRELMRRLDVRPIGGMATEAQRYFDILTLMGRKPEIATYFVHEEYDRNPEEFCQTNEVYMSLFGIDPARASQGIRAYCDEVAEDGVIHDVSHLNLALITWKAANKNYHHKC